MHSFGKLKLEFVKRTEMQSFGKLAPPKRNAVRLGGELAPDQRLSGLASGTDVPRPQGLTSPPTGGRKDANFQSISYQLTVFLRPIRGSAPA